jgi:beta-lactamase regulating signal transducer with metallopeptidase domain
MVVWTLLSAIFLGLFKVKRFRLDHRFGIVQALYFALPLGFVLSLLCSWTWWSPVVERKFTNWIITQKQQLSSTFEPLAFSESFYTSNMPSSSLAWYSDWMRHFDLAWGLVFLLGLVIFWRIGHFILEWNRLRHFREKLHDSENMEWQQIHTALCHKLGLDATKIRLCECDEVAVPFTFGWRKPVVVLPACSFQHIVEVEQVLFHELMHIRHNDFAWHIVERWVGIIFGFHPMARLLQKRIALFREQLCDAAVLALGRYKPAQYAQLLFRFSTQQTVATSSFPVLSMSNHFDDLKTRLISLNEHKKYENSCTHWMKQHQRTKALSLLLFGVMVAMLVFMRINTYEPPPIFTQYARQVSGCTFQLRTGTYIIKHKGEVIQDNVYQSSDSGCDLAYQKTDLGVLMFSVQPFAGAVVAGYVKGNDLYLTHEGFELELHNSRTLFGQGEYAPIYAHYLSDHVLAEESLTKNETYKNNAYNMLVLDAFSANWLRLSAKNRANI